MKQPLCDDRKSFLDLNMEEMTVGGNVYHFEGTVDRGGSCLVYSAAKQVKIGRRVISQRVLLKEFYPLLDPNTTAGIFRNEDGSLSVPQATKDSLEYINAVTRFQDACAVMYDLGTSDTSAETSAVPLAYLEDLGTYYLEEAYDSGIPLSEAYLPNLNYFFDIYLKSLRSVKRLHDLGYYHLDIKPHNISYTRGGNIKFFDTDSFIKKEHLHQFADVYQTEGYSAPELLALEEQAEDATYLIGPWTDIYSLTQLLCWYLFGHPLEYYEIEEAMEQLEEKVQQALVRNYQEFGMVDRPLVSQKGLYRLKQLILRNLSPRINKRMSSVLNMSLEVELIKDYLYYRTPMEPMDNFTTLTNPLPDLEPEMQQLESILFDPELDNQPYYMAAVTIIGLVPKEREQFARSYATRHRMDYSNIVEIHCKDFTKLKEQIEVYDPILSYSDLLELKNPHRAPMLFLLFDESEKDVLSRREAKELAKLIHKDNCQLLLIGKYNRCKKHMNRLNTTSEYFETISLDRRRDDAFFQDVLEVIRQEKFARKKI